MKKVLFLDDDKSLCFLMLELFEENPEVDITTVQSFAQLAEMEAVIQSFDVIFLDVNLGGGEPTGLDAFDWLEERGFGNKVVFFTGHANAYPEVKTAIRRPNVFVLEKPATIAQIENMIGR